MDSIPQGRGNDGFLREFPDSEIECRACGHPFHDFILPQRRSPSMSIRRPSAIICSRSSRKRIGGAPSRRPMQVARRLHGRHTMRYLGTTPYRPIDQRQAIGPVPSPMSRRALATHQDRRKETPSGGPRLGSRAIGGFDQGTDSPIIATNNGGVATTMWLSFALCAVSSAQRQSILARAAGRHAPWSPPRYYATTHSLPPSRPILCGEWDRQQVNVEATGEVLVKLRAGTRQGRVQCEFGSAPHRPRPGWSAGFGWVGSTSPAADILTGNAGRIGAKHSHERVGKTGGAPSGSVAAQRSHGGWFRFEAGRECPFPDAYPCSELFPYRKVASGRAASAVLALFSSDISQYQDDCHRD
jgi:hypothetical protein